LLLEAEVGALVQTVPAMVVAVVVLVAIEPILVEQKSIS
jgi:hypothetical protein